MACTIYLKRLFQSTSCAYIIRLYNTYCLSQKVQLRSSSLVVHYKIIGVKTHLIITTLPLFNTVTYLTLIESLCDRVQSHGVEQLLEAMLWQRLRQDVCDHLICRNILEVNCSVLYSLTNEVVPYVDMLGPCM